LEQSQKDLLRISTKECVLLQMELEKSIA